MGQSRLTYPKDRPEYGVEAGDREKSFCFFQIHEPAHEATIKKHGLEDFKINPESCVKMARIVYDNAGGFYPWTEYHKMLAMR